ncbi:hypothetical protein TNCV_5066101 [Trichonephila clavipes]|nr:hypothetical protein TNCV_5066101 [Trichonephila clavipes]
MDSKKLNFTEVERKEQFALGFPPTFHFFIEKLAYVLKRDVIDFSRDFQKHPEGRQVDKNDGNLKCGDDELNFIFSFLYNTCNLQFYNLNSENEQLYNSYNGGDPPLGGQGYSQ